VIDHAGIIEQLGFATDNYEWTLEGTESTVERLKKDKEERKEPKEIICGDCGTVYRSRRDCPECGHESVPKGEPIPVHQAVLKEVVKAEKFTSDYKEQFYRELLGYCRRNGKKDGFAYFLYQEKFHIGPAWKKIAAEPSQETIGFVKHRQIARAKAAA
jgi:hypothetical protein